MEFGRCRRVRYALHEIEPLLSAHNDGFPSVLDELVLNRRADVLALPTPLAVLLHDKWLACGRWAALQHVVGLFLSMVLVLVALALATADQHDERFGPDGGCGPWHTNQTFDAWWTDLGHAMSESFSGRGSAAHRGSAVVVCLLAWSLLKLLLFVLRPLWVVSVPQSAILKLDRARRSQGRVRAALRWLKQRSRTGPPRLRLRLPRHRLRRARPSLCRGRRRPPLRHRRSGGESARVSSSASPRSSASRAPPRS